MARIHRSRGRGVPAAAGETRRTRAALRRGTATGTTTTTTRASARASPPIRAKPGHPSQRSPPRCCGRSSRRSASTSAAPRVTISPEPTTKGAYREVMTKLVSENQHTELGGRFPAYDGRDSLFTVGALPFGTKEFEVTLSAGGDKRMDTKYRVVINHASAISLLQLRMLLAGYSTDIPAQALQVLETMLGDVLFNERNDIERVPIGTNNHTLGVEAWKGLYQSIRSTQDGLSLIADVSSSVFVQPLLLIDFVQKTLKTDIVDRNLTEPEYDKLLKALRGVKIEVTHRGNKRRSFESPGGATKTVIDHFRERYSLDLKYKSLPCIDVGSEQKPIYLPIEVCKIVPRKCYQKKLEGSQVSILRKSASIQPEPEQSSRQVVDRKRTKRANEFGIEFDDNLTTTVDARVLLPPNLKYHDSGSQKTWFPMNGYWNMKDKKVINGAKISNWACVNFCEDLSKKVIEEFCFKLAEMFHITGVDFDNLKLPIFTARPDQVEHDIHICYQEVQNKLRDQKIDLLLAILPDENGSLYGSVRQILVSCHSVVEGQMSSSKAGGRDSVFDDVQKSLPVVSNKPTIIFGAHVSHPSAVNDSAAPSIASAWKALHDNEKPQITFIVVQKKHRLRLFPMDNKYRHRSATKKIVEPGTVVDSEICHPAEFDFFLCSHAEMKVCAVQLCKRHSVGVNCSSRVYLAQGSDTASASSSGSAAAPAPAPGGGLVLMPPE
ncbi:unnamed protein product [Miscanthus lutarioriparius]|uniref:PAZ domain-containing protein n=1 Tax=Miscanthus lutarioriparius TaxID=422564 RepID=A0A811NGX7_9POAL|nr:unnamed protein product [Miscanthus lutarioriparius]